MQKIDLELLRSEYHRIQAKPEGEASLEELKRFDELVVLIRDGEKKRADLVELARGSVEANLCADWDPDDGDPTADYIFDDAYVLAFDKLHDAGVDNVTARDVATEVAQAFAQP